MQPWLACLLLSCTILLFSYNSHRAESRSDENLPRVLQVLKGNRDGQTRFTGWARKVPGGGLNWGAQLITCTSPPTTFCLCFLPPDFFSSFFSVYMGLTCSSSLSLWKSNPGSKEIQSIVGLEPKGRIQTQHWLGCMATVQFIAVASSHVRLFETRQEY